MARGAAVPGTVTATFGTGVQHAAIVVSRYSGVDPTDPLGALIATNSAGGDCSGGGDGEHYALGVTTLTEGGLVYLALGSGAPEHRSTSGLFARQRGGGTAAVTVEVLDRAEDAGDHAVTGSFAAAVDWTAVAFELRSNAVDEDLRSAATLDVRPNPFNGAAHIGYTLYRRAHVEILIFDARGHLVRTLFRGGVAPGRLQLDWDARDDRGLRVQSGVYFLRLQSEGHTVSRKAVLLK
jgi:hypothetical protein